MTREEFNLNHDHNVFTFSNGQQCEVTWFNEGTQEIGIRYLSNGDRGSIPVTRYMYEIAYWPPG